MQYLVDVNVWIAVLIVTHVHHPSATRWLNSVDREDELLFCRITQQGLLRLLTNARVMQDDIMDAKTAWENYDSLRIAIGASFAEEPRGLENEWRQLTRRAGTGPNFWTDAYLAAFALATGSTVVTFDRAFPQHRGLRTHILATK